jgi:hypothetical protein
MADNFILFSASKPDEQKIPLHKRDLINIELRVNADVPLCGSQHPDRLRVGTVNFLLFHKLQSRDLSFR